MKKGIFILMAGCLMLASCADPKSRSGEDPVAGQDELHRHDDLYRHTVEKVSFLDVTITDHFWRPKIEKNRVAGIRSVFKECSHSMDNFDIAAGKKEGEHKGTVASDSDVYKIIQGAAYALHHAPDEELEVFIDSLIDRIVAAQQPARIPIYLPWMPSGRIS